MLSTGSAPGAEQKPLVRIPRIEPQLALAGPKMGSHCGACDETVALKPEQPVVPSMRQVRPASCRPRPAGDPCDEVAGIERQDQRGLRQFLRATDVRRMPGFSRAAVSVEPGLSTLTRMHRGANSTASWASPTHFGREDVVRRPAPEAAPVMITRAPQRRTPGRRPGRCRWRTRRRGRCGR